MSLQAYLPQYYRRVKEMVALLQCEDKEMADFRASLLQFGKDSSIQEASEEAIERWEHILQIMPTGTLAQRRMNIISILRGQGRLNAERIGAVVNAFTAAEDSVIVDFLDSEIRVRVLAPRWGEIYIYPDIEKALLPLIPAHLGLRIERFYNTWADRKEQYESWAAIATVSSWREIKEEISAV